MCFSFHLSHRLNDVRVQHDFLKQIPRRAEITLPSSQIDWKSKELNLPTDVNIWNNLDLSGKREWPLLVEEPHYVLVRSDDDKTQHLGIKWNLIFSFFLVYNIFVLFLQIDR